MIKIVFYGPLADIMGRERVIDSYKGNVGVLIDGLCEGDDDLRLAINRARVKFAVNDKIVSPDTMVENGDDVAALPPFSGG